MGPAWVQLYQTYAGLATDKEGNKIEPLDCGIAKVDCTKTPQLCADQHITGYPT